MRPSKDSVLHPLAFPVEKVIVPLEEILMDYNFASYEVEKGI